MDTITSLIEDLHKDLQEIHSFVPTKEQKEAMDRRDRAEASRLGVNPNQYLGYKVVYNITIL